MLYCSHCRYAAEKDRCPLCGSRKLRELRKDDLCLAAEKESLWAPALADLLRENGIPFESRSAIGAGLAAELGAAADRVRFFVPYEKLEAAKELEKAYFSRPPEE